jgi:ketosteroid isomerase-like protein
VPTDSVDENTTTGARAEIERLTAEFAAAVTNKNFAALGSFYEERARLLVAGAPMIEGRAAIQAAQQRLIERGVQALKLDVVDVMEAGDLAVEIGRYTLTIQPSDGPLLHDRGKSVVIWRRQNDGGLRITVDTFTSDVRGF